MNFDRLAPHYPWLETIFAGGLMQRCRTAFLPRTRHCRQALLAGEGTGKFLVELLRQNPDIQVTCVEQSGEMLAQIKARLQQASLESRSIKFLQMDVLNWNPPARQFDLIVTNFFLDCFRAEQLQRLVRLLADSATENAIWLVADFRLPERGWRRWRARLLLTALYLFFRLFTALSASRLTPPEKLLEQAGFALVERRPASLGFAHADHWQRTIS